jgi:parallel beta-helix repeat protein
VTAGINLEAGSTGGIVRNNVSTDNGLGTKGNIRVDSNSISGTTVDYDLVNISTSWVMFVWGSTTYKTLSAFRTATGQEPHGIQANPLFVSPADDNFQLDVGSPAIDSADSGAPGEQAIDLAGAPRVDSPTTVDTGTGPRTFDDRGAYEYQPTALNDYYVDQSSSSCVDTGPGTQTRPFCRIAPAAERAIAGQTVNVLFGTYTEEVTPNHSGQSGAPIMFRGSPGTIITGSASGYGFKISGKSWIVVSGFTVRNTVSHGIYIANSSFITVSGNDVSYAGQPTSGYTKRGIYLGSATDSLIASNVVHHNTEAGIYLDAGSARITVENNEAYGNARQYTRGAPAIDLRGADNLILFNWVHDNEDTGVQSYTGATRNLIAMNLAYRNGDHGIDDLGATNQTIIGNTVFQNVTAGINLEGGSTGGTVRNNISIDNGIGSARTKGNIRVDSSSISGTTVDYDLVQVSSSGVMFVWGSTNYNTLSAFRTAIGQEQQGIQANPLFLSPASDDYRVATGSLAIDSADSGAAGEQMFDLAGASRIDDPATLDTGAGPRTYDDRGAYEYQPPTSSARARHQRKRAQCLTYWTWLSAPTVRPLNCHAQARKVSRR